MNKIHIVSLFYFNSNIAGKDMFLAPMYLGQHLGASVEFVYPKADFNKEFEGEYRGVKLTPIKSKSQYHSTFISEKEMLWWLIKNARKIDVLFLFWLNTRNLLFSKIYKILNPKGICYIKGDFNEACLLTSPIQKNKSFKQVIKKWLYQSIDIISAETKKTYYHIKEGALGRHMANIVEYVPNAFDVELSKEFNFKKLDFYEKDNLIITVGRIGTEEKNNEMMLAALEGIDIKNWKFIFVGSVEDTFREKYNHFIEKNPDKRDSVLLYGVINNKKELWQMYNKAKVFVLTSNHEGFPNVFPEALYFGNYIVTTNFSSTSDVTDNGNIGEVIPIGDITRLSATLLNIFKLRTDIESIYPNIINHSIRFQWDKAIIPISQRIKKILCR